MSGMSRAEIKELLEKHGRILATIYHGCAPEDVCVVYKEINDRCASATAITDQRLRGLTRLLKKWLDEKQDHQTLVAAAWALDDTLNISDALKRARKLNVVRLNNPEHAINRNMPVFTDGVLQRAAGIR